MPDQPPEQYRRLFEFLEELKQSKHFDDHMTAHLNLLIAVSRASTVSLDAIKHNTKSIVNARIAARFIGGPS